VLLLELPGGYILADVHAAVEDDAFRLHLLHAPVDDVLLHLEVGDAVGEEPAGPGALLVDVHLVAGARELLGRGEAGGAGADYCNPLAGLGLGRLGRDPAFLERPVGDGTLDGLDGDRRVVDVERTGCLARRRAHAPRHLREVVGRVQVEGGRLPLAAVDEVVPVGDLVVYRAAVVAVGDAAIHAACRLRLGIGFRQRLDELAPMLHALLDRPVMPVVALELHEACDLAHLVVIPGLVPGIHLSNCAGPVDGWIPGTRPGMTTSSWLPAGQSRARRSPSCRPAGACSSRRARGDTPPASPS